MHGFFVLRREWQDLVSNYGTVSKHLKIEVETFYRKNIDEFISSSRRFKLVKFLKRPDMKTIIG